MERVRGLLFFRETELFLDLQCHPAESWELPVMGLTQCLGKSCRVHMTQQNIRICIPISWEAGLISTNKCCEPVRVLGWVCHWRIKRNLKKKKKVVGRWTFESLRDFPSRLHSNPTDPNLAELCYCSMSKTFAWNVGHVNLDSPRSSPVWPSRPPPLQTHWSGGPDAEPRTRSIEKGRDPKGKLSAAFLPVSLCRLTVHSDEPSRDGKQALGNRSVDLFALRRKQEYELTYSFSGFVLGHMRPGEKKKKKKSRYNYLFPKNSRSNICCCCCCCC